MKNFFKHSNKNKFYNLEIDARIVIFSHFFFNEYKFWIKNLPFITMILMVLPEILINFQKMVVKKIRCFF